MKEKENVLSGVVNVKNSKIISNVKFETDYYLKLDLDSLYEKVAKVFCDDEDFVLKGKKILESIDHKLYQNICNDMKYCKNKNQFTYLDTKSLVELLIQNLEDVSFKNKKIPKTLLAVILVKIGLARFCKC